MSALGCYAVGVLLGIILGFYLKDIYMRLTKHYDGVLLVDEEGEKVKWTLRYNRSPEPSDIKNQRFVTFRVYTMDDVK